MKCISLGISSFALCLMDHATENRSQKEFCQILICCLKCITIHNLISENNIKKILNDEHLNHKHSVTNAEDGPNEVEEVKI